MVDPVTVHRHGIGDRGPRSHYLVALAREEAHPAVGFRRQGRGFTAGGAGQLTATVMLTDDGGEQEAEAAA